MSEIYGYSNREAIRVKVKKCESNIPSEWRKFSIDPQITSLEVLYSILAKAFDIKSDFSICYKTLDPAGDEAYLAVLSDWDLDAAFLKAHNISVQTGNEPCLSLRVDIKTTPSEVTDWESGPQITRDFFSLQQSIDAGQKYVQNMQNKLPGLIMNQMEKTFSMVQRALNLSDDQVLVQPPRPPLSDSEFRSFLDSVGQILRPNELRKVIFIGGIDPSLRKVVWKHILNIYPNGMTGRERIDYMKKKASEYYKLRDVWKTVVQKGPVLGELAYVTSMVRKDVLRTDRLHPFYAGSDDNQNIASLFNILTTYALNHPSVSYCQGMSDIASPLLVTMGDEAHAYICFCAIMSRLKENFMLDGVAMTLKFTHLAEALHFYDPEFYDYLKLQQADDLLFCYRWLLLEMKREFAFEDSLRMLEVLWSSLRYEPPVNELNLYEKEFEPSLNVPVSPSPSVALRTPRENHYTKVCALRRQSSSVSLVSNSINLGNSTDVLNDIGKLNVTKRLNQSLDENIPRLSRTKNIIRSHQSLDENKMIRLMESMTMFEDKTIDNTQNVITNNEEESTTFAFHPTNPFFNDADIIKSGTLDKEQNRIVIDDELNNDDLNEEKQTDSRMGYIKSPNNNTKIQNKHFFSSNAEDIISKQLTNKKSGHFKELKEKLAASKKGIRASFDKIENQFEITKSRSQNVLNSRISDSGTEMKNQKVVKNFKEFLNLSSISKNQLNEINSTLTAHANKRNKKDDDDNMVTSRSFDNADSLAAFESTNNSQGIKTTQSEEKASIPKDNIQPLKQLQHLGNVTTQQTQQYFDNNSSINNRNYLQKSVEMNESQKLKLENLDDVFGSDETLSTTKNSKFMCDTDIKYEKLDRDSIDTIDVCTDMNEMIIRRDHQENDEVDNLCKRISTCSTGNDVFVWENPLHQMSEASSCNFNEITIEENNIEMNKCTENSTMNDDSIIESLWQTSNAVKTKRSPTALSQKNIFVNSTKKNCDDFNVTDTDNTNNWKNSSNSSLKTQDIKQQEEQQEQQQQQQQQSNQILNVFKEPSSKNEKSIIDDSDTVKMNTSKTSCNSQTFDEVTKMNTTIATNTTVTNTSFSKINILPSPKEFGGGNPFLIFLCLTLLLQHRNFIIKNGLDYNEMAMHFDKMVRKHDVNRVLNQARRMYFEYLKTQQQFHQHQQQQQQQQQKQQQNNRVSSTNYLESYSNYKS